MTDTELATPDDVLRFWLGDQDVGPTEELRRRWWKKDPVFDQEIRERFLATLNAAKAGRLDEWAGTAEGALALIIVLDQFGRNIHRGTGDMFAGDEKAAALTEASLDRGHLEVLSKDGRAFLLMPLMHSEELRCQDRCVACFEAAVQDGWGDKNNLDYAIQHRDIVRRFGRFPHRNALLGRESTAEELAFLKEPGSSF